MCKGPKWLISSGYSIRVISTNYHRQPGSKRSNLHVNVRVTQLTQSTVTLITCCTAVSNSRLCIPSEWGELEQEFYS